MNCAENSVPVSSLNRDIFQDMESSLPVLPSGIPQLLRALTNEDVGFKELAKIIARFPSVAARLIFLANSSWAAPVAEITTIELACAKLGLGVVRSVSLALSVAAPFNPGRCPNFDAEAFWSSALLVADGADFLAQQAKGVPDIEVQSAHTSGLLHNLGLLWLADNLPEQASLGFSLAEDGGAATSLSCALRHTCGTDFTEVGGILGSAWHFPEVLVTGLKCHNDFSYSGQYWHIAALVGCASTMLTALKAGVDSFPDDLRLQRLGIHASERDEAYQRMSERRESIHELVKTLFPK